MATFLRRLFYFLALAAIAAAITWALWPQPVAVDSAVIGRAPMEVTVEDEGVTRIREVYTVSAPVAGEVGRSPRDVGDEVMANKTVVAVIEPTVPTFLDARSQRAAEAAIRAAEAGIQLAEAQIRQSQTQLDFAKSDLERATQLAERKTISLRTLEKARVDVATAEANLASARATREVRLRELEQARAQLIQPGDKRERSASCCVQVMAPVNGRVLKIITESETVVAAGTSLLEIGDPGDLEIVVDLLSRDAVRVRPGAVARIDSWGGDTVLEATVKRVDPSAFTKVSALGIEEQRVKTVLELKSDHELWRELGHDFRVVAHIVVWRDEDAVVVPLSALFRSGTDWAVFTIVEGTARLKKVEIGERNLHVAQLLGGIEPGDEVILHPSDTVSDGVAVVRRNGAE